MGCRSKARPMGMEITRAIGAEKMKKERVKVACEDRAFAVHMSGVRLVSMLILIHLSPRLSSIGDSLSTQ